MMKINHRVLRVLMGLLPVSLLPFVPFTASAQQEITGKTTVDVGKTGYQQPVTAVFELCNKSHRKLRINAVRPDCNCTQVDYPQGDIGSNDKFQIRMVYDARQLGHFDKQAAVLLANADHPIYLCMKGIVLPEVQDFSASYPIEMGDLLLDKADLEFDDINRGDRLVQELHVYNNSNKVYQPNLMHLPPYLTAVVSPERLSPGRVAKITVTLNSSNLHDYGLTQTAVYLAGNPGDKVRADHEISVSAVLLPSFVGMNATQRQYAPQIELSSETIDIQFDGKSKKSAVIDISNKGRSELNISSLQLFTSGLKVSLAKRRLAPGEATRLKVTAMRDELKRVRTRPRILMITNDPAKPKVTITINSK